MEALPLSKRLSAYIQKHQLERAFQKQFNLILQNPFHPSLHTEILQPKNLHLYSFRITRSYRAIFIYRSEGLIEIIDVSNHYR
ncbi:MAG: hypothetical protein WC654_06090 [Patescibacteria group bacterium]